MGCENNEKPGITLKNEASVWFGFFQILVIAPVTEVGADSNKIRRTSQVICRPGIVEVKF
jgi:hypothetical protein